MAQKKVVVEILISGKKQAATKSIDEITKRIRILQREQRAVNKQMDKAFDAKDQKRAEAYSRKLKQIRTNLAANQKAFNSYKRDVIGGNNFIAGSFQNVLLKVAGVVAAYRTLKNTVGRAVKEYAEFEYTLANVQTLLDEQFETLAKDSKTVMRTYGLAIKDVNKAYFDAISAMIPAAEATEFMHDAARLAIGGVTDLKVSVDGMTSVLNAYQLQISEAGRVADAFFRAQKFGKTTVADLSSHIGRVAPIAAIANMSYQEMLSTLAELTLGGLSTEESVTILRQAIAALIKPAEGAKKVLEEFNVPTGIAEVRAVGMTFALGKLTEAAIAYPDAIAEMIPNIRAFTGVAALNGERLEHLNMIIEDVMENYGEFSSLSEAYRKQMSTLTKQYDVWIAKLRVFMIEFGERLKPSLIWLMDNTENLVKAFTVATAAVVSYTIATKAAAIATALFSKSIRINPLGALVSIVLSAVTAFALFRKEVSTADSYQRDFNDSVEEAHIELGILFGKLQDTNKEHEEYSQTLDAINTKYGDYLDNLLTEESTLKDIATARGDIFAGMKKELAFKSMEEDLSGVNKALVDTRNEIKNVLNEFIKTPFEEGQFAVGFQDWLDEVLDIEDVEERTNAIRGKIQELVTPKSEQIQLPTGQYTPLTNLENIEKAIAKIGKLFKGDPVDALAKLVNKYEADAIKLEGVKQDIIDFYDGVTTILEDDAVEKIIKEGEFRKLTLGQLKKHIEDYQASIDAEKDAHKKMLREKYKDELEYMLELKQVKDVTDAQLKEQDRQIVRARARVYKGLYQSQVEDIIAYNYFLRKNKDFSVKLSESEIKELEKARLDYYQRRQKKFLDHNAVMLKLQLDQTKREVSQMDDGLNKELLEEKVGYVARQQTLKLFFDKQIQAKKDEGEKYGGLVEENQRLITELELAYHETSEANEDEHQRKVDKIINNWEVKRLTDLRRFNQQGLNDLEAIRNKYKKVYEDIAASKFLTDEEKTKLKAENELKEVEDLEKAKLEIKEYYGLKVNKELLNKELELLNEYYGQRILSEEEYLKAKRDLKMKYLFSDEEKLLIQAAVDEVLGLADTMIQASSNAQLERINVLQDQYLEALQDTYNTESTLLQNKLDKGILSEEQYTAKKRQLDEDNREKEKVVKRNAWREEQKVRMQTAALNGLMAITKTLAGYKYPINLAMAGLQAATNTFYLGQIGRQKNPYMEKGGYVEHGGAKSGKFMMIGGKLHREGGTHFTGSDGSNFTAERDELLAIVNRKDTALLGSLSNLNSIHGKSYFANGGVQGSLPINPYNVSNDNLILEGIKEFANSITLAVAVDEIIDKTALMVEVREEARI